MKTRAEIYSKEAADMLRNITTYPDRLFPLRRRLDDP